MTKSQCYSEISRNNSLINGYNADIAALNKDIEELNQANTKIISLKTMFIANKVASMVKLAVMDIVNRMNSRIAGNIYKKMTNIYDGDAYKNTLNSITDGITKIGEEIKRKQNKIRDLQNQINSCRSRINEMYRTIERIEAEERAEAAARAARNMK